MCVRVCVQLLPLKWVSVFWECASPWDERFYGKILTFMNSGGRAVPSSYDSAAWEMEQPLCSCKKKAVLIKMTDCSTPARVNTKVNCTILHCKFSLSGSRWNWTPQRQWTTEQNTVINVTSGEAKLFVHHEWWLLQLSTHTNWRTETVLHWNQRSFKSFGCIIWRNGWHRGHLSNKLKGFSLSLFRFGNQHFSAGRTAASGTSNC